MSILRLTSAKWALQHPALVLTRMVASSVLFHPYLGTGIQHQVVLNPLLSPISSADAVSGVAEAVVGALLRQATERLDRLRKVSFSRIHVHRLLVQLPVDTLCSLQVMHCIQALGA